MLWGFLLRYSSIKIPKSKNFSHKYLDNTLLLRFTRKVGLVNALFGTSTQIDPAELNQELAPVLIEGEQVQVAFKVVRDYFVFTDLRLVLVDKQGLTGKKVEYHSIPYKSITQFSVETAGRFDMDAELKIWISGDDTPISKEFRKGTDVVALQKALATFILGKVSPGSISTAPTSPPQLPK